MATYTVKKTGVRPGNPFAIQTLTIPDASDSGIQASTFSGQQAIMSAGDTMLIRTQTGAIKRYRIDAERSTNGYVVLLPMNGA